LASASPKAFEGTQKYAAAAKGGGGATGDRPASVSVAAGRGGVPVLPEQTQDALIDERPVGPPGLT
jgi:hypothetical protein